MIVTYDSVMKTKWMQWMFWLIQFELEIAERYD